jgi:CRP/FNR family cyclic AMP-dependent transcriptional regulator
MHWADALGYVGAILTVSTYSMKTMIRLRVSGILANCAFIVWGALVGVYPTLLLHLVLLPLNVARLRQMIKLVGQVKQAARGDLSAEWLKPYTHKKTYATGEVLWKRGEVAKELLFVLSGRFLAVEAGVDMSSGDMIGEIGLISPGSLRTQTVQCTQAGEALAISYDEVRQLYFQNPQFGFYYLQLASKRLTRDAERPRAISEPSQQLTPTEA